MFRTRWWLVRWEVLRQTLQPLLMSLCTVSSLAVVIGFVGLLPDIQRANETWPVSLSDCCFYRQGDLAIAVCQGAPLRAAQGWRYFLACSEIGSFPRVPSAWSGLSPSCIAAGQETNVFVGCWDGSIYSIEASNADAPPQLVVRDPRVIPDVMACSPDGVLVVAGYKRITAWDVGARSALWSHSLTASCLAIHPRGQAAVCGTDAGELLELDLHSGLARKSVKLASGVVDLRFNPDGQFLAVVELQGQIALLQWPSLSPAWDDETRPCGAGSMVAFSPDGRLLATIAPQSRSIAIWNAASGTLQRQCSPCDSLIVGAVFVDDLHLASWALDGVVRYWNVSNGAEQREIVLTDLEPAS